MKALMVLLMFGLCLCGCSRGHSSSSGSPLDRVRAGRDVAFGHYVVRVNKRQGNAVQGVRVVSRERDGRTTTITASTGSLAAGPDRSSITLVLHDAQLAQAKQRATIAEMSIDLPIMGLCNATGVAPASPPGQRPGKSAPKTVASAVSATQTRQPLACKR